MGITSWRLNKLGEAWSESGSNESSIEEKRSSDARTLASEDDGS
ncbi:hypothetical protein HanXRQr2_Chr09g0401251 [Helianthus annuus]|uniref:Uncharacterized protein n=1 Tax=Helianthus annuus TaxID=4232 RepID=A0A9K3I8A0_HELAN|nr:hypothetical protein HanXRQr2_Chr09g0401251 [Helianthus annuus]KAJ0915995.1 hypothetical protein HanPSC8_Chr06g0256441 [Helianthus annuus]